MKRVRLFAWTFLGTVGVTRFPSMASLKVGLTHAARRSGRIMKSTFAILLVAALLTTSATSLRADDWKTTDGKVYQNVQVVGSNPEAVTILHQDGGASVPLANLPADIQKRFNYDPAKAEAVAEGPVKDVAVNVRALRPERDRAGKMQQAESDITDNQYDTNIPEIAPVNDDASASAPSASCNPSPHYSIDDLASSMHSLRSDPSDANHHSISEIADSGL
jgi:flagellar basal body rod protein FlgC